MYVGILSAILLVARYNATCSHVLYYLIPNNLIPDKLGVEKKNKPVQGYLLYIIRECYACVSA